MHAVPGTAVEQNVFPVAIPQPHDVPHHGPHRRGVRVAETGAEPRGGLREGVEEPGVEDGGEGGQDGFAQQLGLLVGGGCVVRALDAGVGRQAVEVAGVEV